MLYPQYRYTMSNNLEKIYHDAGQFYFGKKESFLNYKPTFGKKSFPMILPKSLVQDIDDIDDWKIAENLFKTLYESKNISKLFSNKLNEPFIVAEISGNHNQLKTLKDL